MNKLSLSMLATTDTNVLRVQDSSPVVSARRSCFRHPPLGDDDTVGDMSASLLDITTTPFIDADIISCVVDLFLLMGMGCGGFTTSRREPPFGTWHPEDGCVGFAPPRIITVLRRRWRSLVNRRSIAIPRRWEHVKRAQGKSWML